MLAKPPLRGSNAEGAHELYSGIIAVKPIDNRNYGINTTKLDTDAIADGGDKV